MDDAKNVDMRRAELGVEPPAAVGTPRSPELGGCVRAGQFREIDCVAEDLMALAFGTRLGPVVTPLHPF
jgi:hypothetical protein